ncbi:MAG: signal peptide peptidase SppA [Elusimicrobiota bacterium]
MNRDQLLRAILVCYGLALLVGLFSILHPKDWRLKRVPKKQPGSLAIIHIYGPIRTDLSASAWASPDADDVAKRLHRLSENEEVKAILLRINSPGGTVGAVQEIHTEILRCKAKGKKVVASLGDVAASGGYYLASSADRIVTDPGTITGSIGVVMQFGNLQGLFQKVGVQWEVIKSGPFKDIGSPSRPLTPEERRLLQASIDDAYDQFVVAVSTGRKMPVEKLRSLADGRIYTGRQALAAGLVDELGNQEDAVQVAIRLAGLPAQPTILSDTKRSLSDLIKHLSSSVGRTNLETLVEGWSGPSLEYRWR